MEKIIIPLEKGKAHKFLKHLQEEHPKYSRSAYISGYDGEPLFEDELLLLVESYKNL